MWKAGLSHVGRVCAATWFPPWPWVQAAAAARVHGDFCAGPGAVRPWVPSPVTSSRHHSPTSCPHPVPPLSECRVPPWVCLSL